MFNNLGSGSANMSEDESSEERSDSLTGSSVIEIKSSNDEEQKAVDFDKSDSSSKSSAVEVVNPLKIDEIS